MVHPCVPLGRYLRGIVFVLAIIQIWGEWHTRGDTCGLPGDNLPSGDGLIQASSASLINTIHVAHTWDFLLRIVVLKVPIAEPVVWMGRSSHTNAEVTYLSAPTNRPDLASPMYHIWRTYSFNPTRRMLLSVLNRETIM